MKNRYGGPLRQMIAEHFHLKNYVDMVNTPAFHTDVVAYPAITIIAREKRGATRIAHRPPITVEALSRLASSLVAENLPKVCTGVREIKGMTAGAAPWILGSADQLAVSRRLEADFPRIAGLYTITHTVKNSSKG
ncbi:MAG: hypothetical protein H0V62_08220 [Gammaproteobacteria bacterium]|jgi:hypothetical protein|nr:hypothetical protein [Gammaproteobacteria bacterium]